MKNKHNYTPNCTEEEKKEIFDSMKAKQEFKKLQDKITPVTLKQYMELMAKKIKEMYGYTDKEYEAYCQGIKDYGHYSIAKIYDLDSSYDGNKEYYRIEFKE